MTINLADTKYGTANSLKDTIYTRKAPATTAFSTLRITFFNRCKQVGIWKLYWKYYQFEIITNYMKILPIRDSSDKAREKNKRSSDIANNLKLNAYNLTTKESW